MSTAIATIPDFTSQQLALVRKTAAKHADEIEFDNFIEFCRTARLNPLKKQVYLFIYNRDNPKKRQAVIVTSIDGLRAIANRTGDYRADELAPRFTYDAEAVDERTNPLGLVKAEVTVYKFSHGAWFPNTCEARWSEYAPIKEQWAEDETGKRRPTGEKALDPAKEGWTRMPHLMLAKCAEALALRKSWPEDLSGIYGDEEIDRMKTIDLTATEIVDEYEKAERVGRVGGHNTILVDWCDGQPLQAVAVGAFHDSVMGYIKHNMRAGQEEPSVVLSWRARNKNGLNQFWALEKDAALSLKAAFEKVAAFEASEPAEGATEDAKQEA